mgnify:FL=1
MKILILHDYLVLNGATKVLVDYLKILNNLNYEVTLLIKYDLEEENYFVEDIPKGINYKFIFEKKIYKEYFSKNKNILNKVKKEYIRQMSKFQMINRVKNEEKNYDLVIDFTQILLGKNFKLKNPIIAWNHENLLEGGGKASKKRIKLLKKGYENYDKIVSITEKMREAFISELDVEEKKCEILYNPLDVKLIEKKSLEKTSEKYEKLLQEDYFLQVSRLVYEKNLLELVEIYKKLKERGIKEKLYIIGEGEERVKLEENIKKLGLEKDVLLLGKLKNPYPFFRNAKLFLHTSISESFGMVLIESMIFRVPVFAYDCPIGPVDILGKNSENGVLIPLYDKKKYVKKVIEILENRKVYEKYQEKGFAKANNYSMEKVSVQLDKMLKRILKN